MALTVTKVLLKVFGSRNERLLKRYRKVVDEINSFENHVRQMTDEELRKRTEEMRRQLTTGEKRPVQLLPEAFAVIRESMDRNIGIRVIFDPEQNFDPSKLDAPAAAEYRRIQQGLIDTGSAWQKAPIPVSLYEAVRKLYPESRPPFRARCFDVQMIGGLVLYEGKIAEMATGEGKTFVAPLACFMRVLEGNHAHVVTVNDYLVRRDAMWVKPAFEALGISVGFIQADLEPGSDNRRLAYASDITYGTNAEFGFDYLRDNMKQSVAQQVQGPLQFVVVDEVDSILIDEARTPLIISGAAHDDAAKYRAADVVARRVIDLNKPWTDAEAAVDTAKRAIKSAEGDESKARDSADREKARKQQADAQIQLAAAEKRKEGLTQYYEVELDRKSAHLTHEGIAAAQDAAGVGSFFVGANMEWPHLMEQAMRAHVVYEKDKDYVVDRSAKGQMEIVIVDEYTGRKMTGRQWSDGLHQAVEAKERVPIKEETQTLATITLQNFFRMYKVLSGMTGTAQTEAEEFNKIYKLDVVTIPTNRPCVRADNEDRVYRTETEKWEAILEEIKEESDKGRPILVGTTSVEKSEMLSNALTKKYGIEHEVLNAKQHEREAHIIVLAGQQHKNAHDQAVGNVTIATNMAGRGTDIKLTPEVTTAGGLHVIGTERHTARRIDNQLRGRSGRQGDPGSSRFYVSLQDELMKMFAGEWTIKVLSFLGMEEGMAIEDKRISKGILRAQKKVEERNFLSRKNLLDYDEVMEHQRNTFYGMRQLVLRGDDITDVIWTMMRDAIADAVDKFITQDFVAATIAEWGRVNFDAVIDPADLQGMRSIQELEHFIKDKSRLEAETTITASLAEFTGEDPDDPASWDIKGLAEWAKTRFQVTLSPSRIRNMTVDEVDEQLRAAALEQIDKRDCAGLMKYLDPNYAEQELSGWAEKKFGIQIAPMQFITDAKSNARLPAEDICEMIEKRARDAYARREIEYPVTQVLNFAYGSPGAAPDNPYSAEYVRQWGNLKFRNGWTIETVRALGVEGVRRELVKEQEAFMTGGKLEKAVDEIMPLFDQPELLLKAANERFTLQLTRADLEIKSPGEDGTIIVTPATREQVHELLMERGRAFLRSELTRLEQYVLIQIFDQSWKDHLYAMDILKSGIGLTAFAELDPRVQYKMEGLRYFQEMMAGVRDKVTDLIFHASVAGQVVQRNMYRETAAVHEEPGSYGVGESLAATATATTRAVPQTEMQQAAAKPQGEATKVKQLVRETAKVGRNDPCPCGSGKKYKKCHGANAA